MWLVFGGLSVVFTMVNLFLDPKKKGCKWITMCALSLPVLTVLAAFSRINTWVAHEDWSALIDVVPYWSGSLTGFCVLLLALNAIAMLKYQTRRDA